MLPRLCHTRFPTTFAPLPPAQQRQQIQPLQEIKKMTRGGRASVGGLVVQRFKRWIRKPSQKEAIASTSSRRLRSSVSIVVIVPSRIEADLAIGVNAKPPASANSRHSLLDFLVERSGQAPWRQSQRPHEEFKRRIKTRPCCSSTDTATMKVFVGI
jgi:hypothetical protein